jgi:hypothetical protein
MRRLAALALLVVAVAILPARADLGDFHITSFHADLEVQDNAELLVTERIEVEFQEPRHGIYRTIPVRYTDPRGYAYSLGLQFLGATDENGKPYGTKISDQRQFIKIRIGSSGFKVDGRKVWHWPHRCARSSRTR